MKNQATTPHTSACESNTTGSEKKSKNRWFTLSRKNQKGQVAIFVALIFQVIFVFFALLINVGLLVHHKINLQQSTDLAAYYGAMKQAEMLNVIGHVNFQIRQAWKLLTWRYRILGTFGMENVGVGVQALQVPIKLGLTSSGPPSEYNPLSANATCLQAAGLPSSAFPFFCGSHSGLLGWPTTSPKETFCKVECAAIAQGPLQSIQNITPPGTFNYGSANTSGAIRTAISSANANIARKCDSAGTFAAVLLAYYLNSYTIEINAKRELIKKLAVNLSKPSVELLDIEGNKIQDGAIKTFQNNLTEANLKATDNKIEFINGLNQNNSCISEDGYNPITSTNFRNGFINEINFKFLQFYLIQCQENGNANTFGVTSLIKTDFSGFNPNVIGPNQEIIPGGKPAAEAAVGPLIDNAFSNKFSVGFEKDPWCQSYFVARASASPKIPFLPISNFKLHAISVAKPFGGSIGPSYGKTWNAGMPTSEDSQKVDENLPKRDLNPVASANLKDSLNLLMNYSNYIGDPKETGGLADTKYIAHYHDILLIKDLDNLSVSSSPPPKQSNVTSGLANILTQPTSWPSTSNWSNTTEPITSTSYDPLALTYSASGVSNSYMRDIELSVVAPNQFDLTYYSVDADFYNNYYLKLKKGLPKFPGSFDMNNLRPDYGYNKNIPGFETYSVRNQMQVASKIIKAYNPKITDVSKSLSFLPDSVASLLTGWTFMNMTDEAGYTTFPNANTTMKFGKCEDSVTANTDYKSISDYPSPGGTKYPPTPGNCVTGGRTGYSVKIVSQDAINGPQGDIGGPDTGGAPIRNPIPDSFLNFQ